MYIFKRGLGAAGMGVFSPLRWLKQRLAFIGQNWFDCIVTRVSTRPKLRVCLQNQQEYYDELLVS